MHACIHASQALHKRSCVCCVISTPCFIALQYTLFARHPPDLITIHHAHKWVVSHSHWQLLHAHACVCRNGRSLALHRGASCSRSCSSSRSRTKRQFAGRARSAAAYVCHHQPRVPLSAACVVHRYVCHSQLIPYHAYHYYLHGCAPYLSAVWTICERFPSIIMHRMCAQRTIPVHLPYRLLSVVCPLISTCMCCSPLTFP